MIDRIIKNLFEFEAPDSLGTKIQLRAFEVFTFIYLMIYAWEWAFYIPRLSTVVLPLGLANYIDISFFFNNNISVYNAVLITLFSVYPLLIKKQRWLYAIAAFLFHLQYVARFSQGEIPHSANLVGFSILALGLGAVFFRDKSIRHQLIFAFGFILFYLGLGYTTAAFSKLIATGITWVDGKHLWLWVGEKHIDILSKYGEFQLNWLQELALSSKGIATSVLLFGLFSEFFGFMVWFKKFRWAEIVLLIGLHIGIDLTMNIFFAAFTYQLILMGFPWNRWINRLPSSQNLNKNEFLNHWILFK
ncbi:MAG: hypothetical protein JJ971_12015 [Balneolaceae bacterium]|nr:hypothetical protein [Balneolaceae bacterium]MBO6547423.1 hypothetical protein [Balneolaceae bacterium]MBO6647630.1 hypothetical protein [Balneolaceae bacterium]